MPDMKTILVLLLLLGLAPLILAALVFVAAPLGLGMIGWYFAAPAATPFSLIAGIVLTFVGVIPFCRR